MKVFSRLKIHSASMEYYELFIYPTKNLYRKLLIKERSGSNIKAIPDGNYISDQEFKNIVQKSPISIIPETLIKRQGNLFIFDEDDAQDLSQYLKR